MPISSGFNDYPYYYPNRITEDIDPQVKVCDNTVCVIRVYLLNIIDKEYAKKICLFFFPSSLSPAYCQH